MSLHEKLRGKRVYFDANIFIYLVEGFRELEAQLETIRASILNAECIVFTSELTLAEVLVAPFQLGNAELVTNNRNFIEASGAFTLLPTTRETYIRASLYRAKFNMKTPDAIHMASAVEARCEVFVSNDKGIKAPTGIEMVLIGEAVR